MRERNLIEQDGKRTDLLLLEVLLDIRELLKDRTMSVAKPICPVCGGVLKGDYCQICHDKRNK